VKRLINLRLSLPHTDVFARFVESRSINNLQLHKFAVAATMRRSRTNSGGSRIVIIDRRINPSRRAKSKRQAGERRVKIFASLALYIPLTCFHHGISGMSCYYLMIRGNC